MNGASSRVPFTGVGRPAREVFGMVADALVVFRDHEQADGVLRLGPLVEQLLDVLAPNLSNVLICDH